MRMSRRPGPPETAPPEMPPAQAPAGSSGWPAGLKRSSDQLTGGIASVFTKKQLDQAMLEELEDILIQADFGIDMADRSPRRCGATGSTATSRPTMSGPCWPPRSKRCWARWRSRWSSIRRQKPFVILMVGVNGSGKTTTIGKLASLLKAEGKSVMLAAGDTFRAAAIEQLQVWGQRTGAPVVAKPAGSDASGLAFEAVTRAKAEGTDVLIIDTAGRLQNRDELMGELEKIIRVIKKVDPTRAACRRC